MMTVMIAITMATMGRLMKNLYIWSLALGAGSFFGHGALVLVGSTLAGASNGFGFTAVPSLTF